MMTLTSVLLLTRPLLKRSRTAWVEDQTVIDGGTADDAPFEAARREAAADYNSGTLGVVYAFVGTAALLAAELSHHMQ